MRHFASRRKMHRHYTRTVQPREFLHGNRAQSRSRIHRAPLPLSRMHAVKGHYFSRERERNLILVLIHVPSTRAVRDH